MTETEKILQLLATIPDPEIPVISIIDLGIVRHVRIQNNIPEVTITPTYTGCPAMDMIAVDIKAVLQENGYSETHIKTVLSPAWTTKWLSAATKEKLRAYGIA
ncbi:MAG: phenylacetate-CoA oxygenase subunit PaaJ, partial [Saprospiraceae bacterium]|nr:phenylacetate-CoA oxygenase subunit PaaJ [Saprospiraceae bacterium]